MKTKFKSTITVLLTLSLCGCSHNVPSVYTHSTMKYDQNTTKAQLMADWGIPTRTMDADDNTVVLQWDSNQGDTSTFNSQSSNNGVAVGDTNYGFGESDSMAVGHSNTSTQGAGNVDTHICALFALINKATDKVISTQLTGTVDEKCYTHFAKALVINAQDQAMNDKEISHNKNVSIAHGLLGILTAGALVGVAANAN